MKIVREYPFWVWLMRFAYKRMKIAQPEFNGLGVPGIRDKNATCAYYSPRKRLPMDGRADCRSDGHYLCKECIFLDKDYETLTAKQKDEKDYEGR
jgi:hypothetical protein